MESTLEVVRPEKSAKVISLRDRLKGMPRGKPVPVDMSRFPDWPQGELYIRPLTARELTDWEKDGIQVDKKGKISLNASGARKAKLVRLSLCHENGEAVFMEADEKDVALMDAIIVDYWHELALELNGRRSKVEEDEDGEDEGN